MKPNKLFCSPAKRIFLPFDPTLTAYDPQQREVKLLNVPCKITTRSAKFLKENRVQQLFEDSMLLDSLDQIWEPLVTLNPSTSV